MGLAEAANLVINLKLNDQASGAIAKARTNVDKLGSNFSKIGPLAKQGLGTAISNLKSLGIAAGTAAVGIGVLAVKSGLQSLATLEDATTSVTGAIKQMGLQGKVTADQVAGWANQIESDVQAAFDDKDITAATATLIRYGHITAANIKPAMVIMTDLAAKTGDVGSAADLLAKALADPEKAAGKLARTGVILTKSQQDQIKAMQEAGNVAGAQALLLDALSQSTKGAAAAAKGPYNDALNTLKDTWEDVTRALAVGFLPVLQEVSTYLKGKLADPSFLATVKSFGQSLAGFLSDALDAAKKIPWQSIGDAMKLAGQGAKAAYDLFMGLPDWVKTAVITGWGLNKLTGGALSGIVGELAKGLVKGVLGITAAVVNINAATVNGPGGISGAGGAAGGIGGKLVGLAGTGTLIGAVTLAADQIGRLPTTLQGIQESLSIKTAGDIKQAWNDTINGSTIATAFKPLIDSLLTHIPGSSVLNGPGGKVADQQGLLGSDGMPVHTRVGTSLNPSPGTQVMGPGFTEWMHSQTQQSSDQVQELQRIHQLAADQLGTMTGMAGDIAGLPTGLAAFLAKWSTARSDALAAGFKANTWAIRKEIASKLGVTVSELVRLRASFRSALASELGITNEQLRHLLRQTGHDDEQLAAKLGISVEQLRALKDAAHATAANTAAIKNKNWSPKITVPVTITNKVAISGRQIYDATRRQIIRQGGGPIVE